MRLDNIKIQIALTFPFGHPDKNGVIYSKEAVQKAILGFDKELPIVYRDNNKYQDGVIIGITRGDTSSVILDDEIGVCEIIVDGIIRYGGTECTVNDICNGIVNDFEITALGISV